MAQNQANKPSCNMKIYAMFVIVAWFLFFLYINILHNENSSLRKEIAHLHDTNKLVNTIDELGKENNILKEEIKELEKSKGEITEREKWYKAEIAAKDKRYKAEIAEKDKRYTNKEKELYKTIQERNRLLSENKGLRQSNNCLNSKVSKLEKSFILESAFDHDNVYVGDTKETVRKVLGDPTEEYYTYEDGKKFYYGDRSITFNSKGLVVRSDGIEIQPLPRRKR